jgi:hypothetical protein
MRGAIVRFLIAQVLTLICITASGAGLGDISTRDATAGLREALTRGTQTAVAQLGKPDGFFRDAKVRIPLPESLARVEGMMRAVGLGGYADDMELRMNRAAEAAVPEARALFVNAVKQMTVGDAKSIISGPQDAATQYFRRLMSDPLAQKFRPIVQKAMDKLLVAQKYDEFARAGARFGLLKKEDANLEDYVTRKTLDGLFSVVADEEKKIRDNPRAAASAILRRVFEAAAQR